MQERTAAAPKGADALDDVIYRISHDLRASVRAMRDLPEWLEEDLRAEGGEPGASVAEILDLMSDHAARLDGMLEGLLAHSRVGRLQDRRDLLPGEVFEKVLAALDPGPGVTFYRQFASQPVSMGEADAAKIFQILLSNALTHARRPDRGLEIEVASCRSGDMWELLFADNGPGIRAEVAETVFLPMVRQTTTGQEPWRGAGMGLAVLRKIAEVYGGTVDLEHRRRRGGALFRLRLPVLADTKPAAAG